MGAEKTATTTTTMVPTTKSVGEAVTMTVLTMITAIARGRFDFELSPTSRSVDGDDNASVMEKASG